MWVLYQIYHLIGGLSEDWAPQWIMPKGYIRARAQDMRNQVKFYNALIHAQTLEAINNERFWNIFTYEAMNSYPSNWHCELRKIEFWLIE